MNDVPRQRRGRRAAAGGWDSGGVAVCTKLQLSKRR